MAKWFERKVETTTEIVERVEPVEIPNITETKRRIARGEYDEALQVAYLKALEDFQRAYDLKIPPGRSHGEILSMELPEGAGKTAEFLRRLYALYQPVRFGPGPNPKDEKQLASLLQSLYSPRAMWSLYILPKREGGLPPGPPVGTGPDSEPAVAPAKEAAP